MTNLQPSDFIVLDSGRPVTITNFHLEPEPISLGFLADFSGSMGVAARRSVAREGLSHLLSLLEPGVDRAGLYVFDRDLRELQPLAPAPGDILAQFDRVNQPFGVTSLFDAIAETGRRMVADVNGRRAVIAFTDGADNASALSAPEVSGIASSIDVPVYVIVVISPFDRAGRGVLDDQRMSEMLGGPLGNLARWTGGEIYAGLGSAQLSLAARQIVSDLRQQYLLAFEPGSEPGWHPLEVRTRDDRFVVRARSGYFVRNDGNGS